MVISEKTKQIVSGQKAALKNRYQANLAEIGKYQNSIAQLKAVNVNLRVEYEALEMDIPEPTPAPPEV